MQLEHRIPLLDLRKQYFSIKAEIDSAIAEVLESGAFILGPNVEAFEAEFANYCGVKMGVAVASGSDALLLSLAALGLGNGDEVITASNTFISTVDAISKSGARPVLVDIDPRTYTLDVQAVERSITPRTKAVIPVHMYGHPAKMLPLCELAESKGIRIVEDACQAQGAEYDGRRVGAFGDVSCFSFYPSKNLGAYGDGGMIVTNDSEVADELRILRNYGQTEKNIHKVIGFNSRLDEIQAAVLRVKLRHLDKWVQARRRNASEYSKLFGSVKSVKPPIEAYGSKHAYYLYVIMTQFQQRLEEWLNRWGISTGKYYPVPVHLQQAYRHLGLTERDFPTTLVCSRQVLALPMFPELTSGEIEYVASKVTEFFQKS